jgi:hypothetical protein
VIEFVAAEKWSVRNIHRCFCGVYGNAAVDRTTVGRWTKRLTTSETGEEALYVFFSFFFLFFFPAQAILSQLLDLKSCKTLMPLCRYNKFQNLYKDDERTQEAFQTTSVSQ